MANWVARLSATGLAILALLQVVQGGVAEAARLIGVDEAHDRIVEIDTASGAVETVVAGSDVRAERIVWSPDESFAYLISSERDEISVYDPLGERIVARMSVESPTDVVFHPTEDRAYVLSCGVVVLDTATHRIVESFDGFAGDYLAVSRSGRWLFGVAEYDWVSVRDLWSSASYEGALYEMDPGWFGEDVHAIGVSTASDAVVLAADQAVWTFDPESRELRRFPYQGAGMGFAMVPDSDVAVVVAHRDIAQIDLTTGETNVLRFDPPLWPSYRWDYHQQVFFSDDRSTVLSFQGDQLVARNTATLETAWSLTRSEDDLLSLAERRVVTGDGTSTLLIPREWRSWPVPSFLIDGRDVVATLELPRLHDAAWRGADRSFYLLSESGLARLDVATATPTEILADARFADVALAGGGAFVRSGGDLTVRSLDLEDGRLSEVLAQLVDGRLAAPLALDPSGTRLYEASWSGLTVYDVATGQVVQSFATDEVGISSYGPIASMAVLDGDIAVLGFGYYDYDNAVALVLDVSARAIIAEHEVAHHGSPVRVARERLDEIALVGSSEEAHYENSRPVVARIAATAVLPAVDRRTRIRGYGGGTRWRGGASLRRPG